MYIAPRALTGGGIEHLEIWTSQELQMLSNFDTVVVIQSEKSEVGWWRCKKLQSEVP